MITGMTTAGWIILSVVSGMVALLMIINYVMDAKINRPRRKERQKFFLEREKLDRKVWHERYFAPLGISYPAAAAVGEALSRAFHCDATQFWPSDAFDKEFAVNWVGIFCSMGIDPDDEMLMFWGCEWKESIGTDAYRKMEESKVHFRTVGELATWYDGYLKEKGQSEAGGQVVVTDRNKG